MSAREKFPFPTTAGKGSPAAEAIPESSDTAAVDFEGHAVDDAQSAMAVANRRADGDVHEKIAQEAYRIAQESGFPPNAELDHWLEAERRLGYDHPPLSIGP